MKMKSVKFVQMQRNKTSICVVETVADLWALERSNVYNGKYHILGGVFQP